MTTLLFFGVTTGLLAARGFCITLLLCEGLEHESLRIHLCVGFGCSWTGQGSFQCRQTGDRDRVREGHCKLDEKVAEPIRRLIEWEAFLCDCLNIVGLDDLTWLVFNSNLSAIEVCEDEVNTSECFDQRNFVLDEQVGTSSLELLVFHLFDDNDDITWLLTGVLVSFAVEGVFGTVGCTLINRNVDNLLLLLGLLSIANFALVGFIDDLTFAAAVIARALRLRVHAGSKLRHASHDTASTAGRTLFDSAFFATFATTWLTDAVSVDSNLGRLAIVNLFEGAFQWVHDGLALLWSTGTWTTTAHAAEHLAEDVISAAAASFFETFLAILVISFSLLTIGEHLVGLLNFLELFFVTAAVRMVLPRQLEVSLFDRAKVCILLNTQVLVVRRVVDFLGLASAGHAAGHAAHTFKVTEWETSEHVAFAISSIIIGY